MEGSLWLVNFRADQTHLTSPLFRLLNMVSSCWNTYSPIRCPIPASFLHYNWTTMMRELRADGW